MFNGESPNWAEGLTAIFSMATLFAVVLAALQIRQVNKQMHREFEMQYLHRFWQLYDAMSDELKMGKGYTTRDRTLAQDYFTLCEDQIGLRKIGRVTDQTWGFWKKDMRRFCEADFFSREFSKCSGKYPKLFRVRGDDGYDPLQRSRVKRYFRGL